MSVAPPPTDLFYRRSPLEPLALAAAPRVLVPDAAPAPWPAATPDAGSFGYERSHANASRNGRVPFALPRGTWRVRPPIALPDERRVTEVLDAGDRVVARADLLWVLAQREGPVLATGATLPGEVAVDQARGEFLCVGTAGGIEARALADGARRWVAGVYAGGQFDRPMVHRHGPRLVTLGVERRAYAHDASFATQTVFESLDVGDAVAVDADGWVVAREAPRRLFRDRLRMLAAWCGDVLLAATDDRFYRLSPALDVLDVSAEGFSPLSLSADAAGRAWAVTRTAQGTLLVVVDPTGRVVLWHPLPAVASASPPIVSHGHRAFVLADDQLHVAAPEGTPAWRRPVEGSVVGASVTGDDHLLVTFRNELVFYDDEGRVTERIGFAREALTTAPVLTARGDILVGGVGRVHRIST